MKLGAVPTFILGREGVEFLEAGGLPMGIVQNAEPVTMSRKMWDGEKIIMISDGILEAMPGNTKKRRSWNLYQTFPAATRRNWQNRSRRLRPGFRTGCGG